MLGPGAAQRRIDLQYAEDMGYDCGMNGADRTNCHFAIFSKPEFTKAWEKGKARADAEKRIPPQSRPE